MSKQYKQEAIELASELKSSDRAAQVIAEKYGISNIASLGRKIRKWSAESRPIVDKPNGAKILIFDIETSPLLVRTWSRFPDRINDDDILEDWSILCFSAKWLFESEVMSFAMTERELKNRDDSRIVRELWKLLDESDMVVTHNGNRFDIKKSNTKFLQNRLGLPSHYHSIDTLVHAKRKFAITSNKLDYIGKYLEVGEKVSTPYGMWNAVMNGDFEMLKVMSNYCDGDVTLLEKVYLELRPYMQPHPNVGLYIDDNIQRCTCCGSDNLVNLKKPYVTTVAMYTALRCGDCSALMRSKEHVLSKEKRKSVLVSTP